VILCDAALIAAINAPASAARHRCISVLLSLVATPTAYFVILQLRGARVFKLLRPRE
jgi:hypothetical protein